MQYFATFPYLAKVFQKNRTVLKNSNKKIYLLGILLLSIVALVFWLLLQSGKGGTRYNWREHYRGDSRDPYGVTVIRQLLKGYFPGQPFKEIKSSIAEELPLNKNQPVSSYVFVGEAMFYDTADIRVLMEYIALGNTVFLSCKTVPQGLIDYLYDPEICETEEWEDISWFVDDSVTLSLLHPTFGNTNRFDYWYDVKDQVQYHEWHYLDSAYLCADNYLMTAIGKVKKEVNFIKIDQGLGTILLHTTPIAFTNYHLRRESGKAYIESVLSHLPEGPVYWDSFSQIPEFTGRSQNNSRLPSNGWDDSPLTFMLSHPPLAWAWYLLLILVLIYLVFRARRRQRIVPVLPANRNTSKEFIENIGRLYYLQDNPQQLANLKFRLFLHDVREKYHIAFKEPDDAFVLELSRKSGVDSSVIKAIVQCHKELPTEYDQHAALQKLHGLMESFYSLKV